MNIHTSSLIIQTLLLTLTQPWFAYSQDIAALQAKGFTPLSTTESYTVLEHSGETSGQFRYLHTDGSETTISKAVGAPGPAALPEPMPVFSEDHWKMILRSSHDVLAEEFLSDLEGDPSFQQIKALLPPISNSETFVGMKEFPFEVYVAADGSIGMDGGFLSGYEQGTRQISKALRFQFNGEFISAQEREEQMTRGLLGGWMPATQTVYTAKDGSFGWEQLVFMGRSQGIPVVFFRFRISNLTQVTQTTSFSMQVQETGSLSAKADRIQVTYPVAWGGMRKAIGQSELTADVLFDLPPSDTASLPTWTLELEPHASQDLYFCIPGVRETAFDLDATAIKPAFFTALKAEFDIWKSFLEEGAQIQIPEPGLEDFYYATLIKTVTAVDGDEVRGGSLHYEGFWPYCVMHQIRVMILCGYPEYARRYMEEFLQNRILPDGVFRFNSNPQRYQVSDIGDFLSVLALYVAYTGDGSLVTEHREAIDRVIGKIQTEREASMKAFPKEDPRHGMIIGSLENDVKEQKYYYSNNGTICTGLQEFVPVLRLLAQTEAQKQQAEELERYAEEFRTQLRTGFVRGIERDEEGKPYFFHIHPLLEHEDHTPGTCEYRENPKLNHYRRFQAQPRMMAGDFLSDDEIAGFYRYQSEKDGTILGVRRWANGTLDDFVSFEAEQQKMRLEMHREYLMKYFAFIRALTGRGTWSGFEQIRFVPAEGENGLGGQMPLKKRHNDLLNGYEGQHPTVAAVKMSREIFSFEEPGGGILYLAGGVSRNWLTRGDPVAASNLATRYGTVSYSLTYEAENRTLTIDLDLEGDTTIPELRIAVRDPMDLGASSVSSSTGQTCTLKGSWVILTDVTESQTLTVIYP